MSSLERRVLQHPASGVEAHHFGEDVEKFLPRKVAADQNGVFTFEGLPVTGDYRLEAESPGFQQSYVITMIDTAQQRAEFKGKPYSYLAKQSFVSIMLQIAPGAESVVVKAKAPQGIPTKSENAAPKRIRLGGQVEAAKQIDAPPPEYPEEARAKGIEGAVVLEAVISMEGSPLNLYVLSSPDLALSEAAMKAVRRWRYKPTLLNGEPVEVVTNITVQFELER